MKLIKDAACEAANSTLEAYWAENVFPIDPRTIAERMGMKVYLASLDENISGFIVKSTGQDPEIYIEESDSSPRRSFTCAHEIGHYVERTSTGIESDVEFAYVEKRDGTTDAHEFYANEFAGNLLMPATEFKRIHAGGSDAIRLAGYFNVSVPAARVRLARLGL